MIQTITIPTARLGANARLLLMIKGSPHAFTEDQLTAAIQLANVAMVDALRTLGAASEGPIAKYSYVTRPQEDEAAIAHFQAAYEWLQYQGLAGQDGRKTVWFKA